MPWQMESPRPTPSPTRRVVKKGSNTRASTSADIPAPVSATSAITCPEPPGRMATRTSFCFASPAGIDCAALRTRFTNTCTRCGSLASTGGAGLKSRTTRARCRSSLATRRSAESATWARSTERRRSSSPRENTFNPRTICATRSAPRCASATASFSSDISAGFFAASGSCSARIARLATTEASGLLISCAMPADKVPSDAVRSLATSRSRRSSRSSRSAASSRHHAAAEN